MKAPRTTRRRGDVEVVATLSCFGEWECGRKERLFLCARLGIRRFKEIRHLPGEGEARPERER